MRRFEVWMEGYAATGGTAYAEFVAEVEAETFEEACVKALKVRHFDMSFYRPESNAYWGCRLFDNEREARRVFG
jgi:hypothetical protein